MYTETINLSNNKCNIHTSHCKYDMLWCLEIYTCSVQEKLGDFKIWKNVEWKKYFM